MYNNFHHDPRLYLIDSDGNKYTVAKPNDKFTRTITITLGDAKTSGGVAIADGTVITGIYVQHSTSHANEPSGVLTWNNLTLTDPTPAE